MASNNNIFSVTNPARMNDALWHVMRDGAADLADMLIFLPSRRAVRGVEKMIAEKMGGAAILPRLVALGEGAEDLADEDDDYCGDDVVGDAERVCVLARMLAEDASIATYSAALPVARDLLRMTDYLENEGVDAAMVDWGALVDEKYAAHFHAKAEMLNILSRAQAMFFAGRKTRAQVRNAGIREWISVIGKEGAFSRVIVCASTASVPATADLMAAVARLPHGRIILSGQIAGRDADFALPTNPYNSEYKFLARIGCVPADVVPIDVGPSHISFFNRAFGNAISGQMHDLSNCHLIECERESEEAAAVAEIAARACGVGQSVLIITPDAAANQRMATEFSARGIVADFSSSTSGAACGAGRAILNMLDDMVEHGDASFDELFARYGNLFDVIAYLVDVRRADFMPAFDVTAALDIWRVLRELSRAMTAAGIVPGAADARAFIADALSGVQLRTAMNDAAKVCVLGTIESRMQTADVVILTGLNDGMFPARGYENAWLPRAIAEKIGLPPGDSKVSLMSLDFMNLSCGAQVYWTRSKVSGGTQTMASRFLSRVAAHGGHVDTAAAVDILAAVRGRDAVKARPLRPGVACPPADWSDVFVTTLEYLIHNPYAFYAKHILRLNPKKDYWAGVDAMDFGNLVHSVLENARDWTPSVLVAQMDARAREILGDTSVLFHFWHRRFEEIAPVAANVLGVMQNVAIETYGAAPVPVGAAHRTVRAKADRVTADMVIDIKTGEAPKKSQLENGNMPQLPLEAYMLRRGGFEKVAPSSNAVRMMFLQLKSGDVRAIEYDAEHTAAFIDAALAKVTENFNRYTAGGAEYEYRQTGDRKYQAWDDLARADD